MEACWNCEYWDETGSWRANPDEIEEDCGECQRFPPLTSNLDELHRWPMTLKFESCGEFKDEK